MTACTSRKIDCPAWALNRKDVPASGGFDLPRTRPGDAGRDGVADRDGERLHGGVPELERVGTGVPFVAVHPEFVLISGGELDWAPAVALSEVRVEKLTLVTDADQSPCEEVARLAITFDRLEIEEERLSSASLEDVNVLRAGLLEHPGAILWDAFRDGVADFDLEAFNERIRSARRVRASVTCEEEANERDACGDHRRHGGDETGNAREERGSSLTSSGGTNAFAPKGARLTARGFS